MSVPAFKHPAALLLAVFFTVLPAFAQSAATLRTAAEVVKRINARNPSLRSFQAGIHVKVRMTSFPFLSPHLDGNAYYKRPGNYEVVFTNAPSYLRGTNQLFADIADPNGWIADSNIAFAGIQTVSGRQYLVLTMTKKIYSDQIKDTVAYIDPATYQVERMEWHYRNGGSISMTQIYRNESGYNVVSSQHVEVHYRVRAVADSSFDRYKTNVPVADSVFTRKN